MIRLQEEAENRFRTRAYSTATTDFQDTHEPTPRKAGPTSRLSAETCHLVTLITISRTRSLLTPTSEEPATVFFLRGTSSPPVLTLHMGYCTCRRIKREIEAAALVQYQSQYRLNQIPVPWLHLDSKRARAIGYVSIQGRIVHLIQPALGNE